MQSLVVLCCITIVSSEVCLHQNTKLLLLHIGCIWQCSSSFDRNSSLWRKLCNEHALPNFSIIHEDIKLFALNKNKNYSPHETIFLQTHRWWQTSLNSLSYYMWPSFCLFKDVNKLSVAFFKIQLSISCFDVYLNIFSATWFQGHEATMPVYMIHLGYGIKNPEWQWHICSVYEYWYINLNYNLFDRCTGYNS